jgi:6-pyruvoyltetrahydropterin/6-carboxytetrahydropterin synthase
MYRLCFRRDFVARHFLVGGEWGGENSPHPHTYRVEWELSAPTLDRHGYLVDLVEVERGLGDALDRYRGALLNDLPEFEGKNPSLERFVKLLWERLSATLPRGTRGAVRLWENDSAWAGYDEPQPDVG